MSEVIARTQHRKFMEETEGFTINEYVEKLAFEVYPLSVNAPCEVSCNDGCDQHAVVYMTFEDAKQWFTKCLEKIKEVLGE